MTDLFRNRRKGFWPDGHLVGVESHANMVLDVSAVDLNLITRNRTETHQVLQ